MNIPNDPTPAPEPQREAFSLVPIFSTLMTYRRPALLALGAVALLYVIFALFVTLRSPVERVASVGFRLLFDGAADGEYPNGDPFSTSDIVSPGVLVKVHTDNALEPYLTVDELKASLVVMQASPELIILTQAYEARLGNPSLTQVARAEIEQEFLQRRSALRVPEMKLSYVRSSRATAVPDPLLQKVLLNVLETWAQFSRDRRGVQGYAIEVLSVGFSDQEVVRQSDPAIKIDMLRRRVDRLIRQSDVIAAIPGAQALTSDTSKQTIGEIRAHLDDLRGFELQVAFSRAVQSTSTAQSPEVDLYLRTRLSEVERKLIEQRGALTRLQDALRIFSGDSIPAFPTSEQRDSTTRDETQPLQLSESFLTTLMTMARRQEDFEYRQELSTQIFEAGRELAILEGERVFYTTALADLVLPAQRVGVVTAEAHLAEIEARIKSSLAAQSEIYRQISALHLDRGGLYRIVVGYGSTTHRGVLAQNLVVAGLTVMLLALILIPLACLAHHTFWVRRRA